MITIRRILLTTFLIAACTMFGQADNCKHQFDFDSAAGRFEPAIVLDPGCADQPALARDKEVEIKIGGATYPARITNSSVLLNLHRIDLELDMDEVQELANASGVTLVVDGKSFELDTSAAATRTRHSEQLNIGPASSNTDDDNGATVAVAAEGQDNNAAANAVRLQYRHSSSYRSQSGRWFERATKETMVSVDTTDQDEGFSEENRVSFDLVSPPLRQFGFLRNARWSAFGRYDQAFHSGNRNLTGGLRLRTYLPIAPLHLLSTKHFIAPPLAIDASYGARTGRAEGEDIDGGVFEGSLLYRIYIADRYRLRLGVTAVVNDYSDRPVDVPRTQRKYSAVLSYLGDGDGSFKVLTSIEEGSTAVVYDKLRNYFIGMGFTWPSGQNP